MITFKCNLSGNTVSFEKEVDIQSMRKEEGYTEIKEPKNEEIKQENSNQKEEVLIHKFVNVHKKRGRPKK